MNRFFNSFCFNNNNNDLHCKATAQYGLSLKWFLDKPAEKFPSPSLMRIVDRLPWCDNKAWWWRCNCNFPYCFLDPSGIGDRLVKVIIQLMLFTSIYFNIYYNFTTSITTFKIVWQVFQKIQNFQQLVSKKTLCVHVTMTLNV